MTACNFAPAHEPFGCTVHHGVRLTLIETTCNRDAPPSDPAAPLDCGAYHPDHPGTRCRQPEGHSGEHATARLDVTWDNAYLSAPEGK